MRDGDSGMGGRYLRALLRLCPSRFRERYGEEVLELARHRLEAPSNGWLRWRAWLFVTADLVGVALAERMGRRLVLRMREPGGGREHEPREGMMESVIQDLRSVLRRVRRSPGFAAVAVVIVALGIGANTAVFTLVNAILLRPPPFAESQHVVRIYQDSDDGDPNSTSFPAYRDMTAFDDVFHAVTASSPSSATWERDEGPVEAAIEFTTSSHLEVVGLPPVMGRWFETGHDQVGAGYFGVVSHHTWRNQMGSDPSILGSVVRLNGRPVTIIGVGPEGYVGSAAPLITDFWLSISSVEVGGSFRIGNLDRREDHWYDVVARLAPDVTVAQAQAAMDVLAARLAEAYPELNQGRDITVFSAADVRVHPQMDAAIAPASAVIMGIAGLVLLLACSNLANLLLARGIARSSEVAVRRAMGASPARVARIFLGESLVLATAGGVLGVGLTAWLLRYADRLPGYLPLPGELDLTLDGRVLGFTVLLVLASAAFFGVFPAVRSMRTDPARALGNETRSASPGRGASALQGGLVAVQVAASVVLLVSAGLLVRSLTLLQGADLGFDPAPLAYLRTTTDIPGLTGDANAAILVEQAREAISGAPGVVDAALTTRLPVGFGGSTTTVVEGYEPASGTGSVELDYAVVTDGYFDVMGLTVIDGRGFSLDDGASGEPIVMVNEAAARRFWAGDAVGGRIRPQSRADAWRRVVGVVADHSVERPGDSSTPMLFYPMGRSGIAAAYVVARSATAGDDILPTLRSELRRVNPALPVSELDTMEGRMGDALTTPRFTAALLGAFALLAVLLASLGIYSVVSFSVARRTAELGIRVALGAGRGRLVASAVLRTLSYASVGIVVGIGLAALAVPLLEGLLFGVSTTDPTSFLGSVALLLALSAFAAWLPARRAAHADPVEALRRS